MGRLTYSSKETKEITNRTLHSQRKTKKEAIMTTKVTRTTTSKLSKLYGRDLSEYDNIDIEDLLDKLSEEELEQLSLEVDPDDNLLPANERCKDQTKKTATGPLNRKKLLEYLITYAKNQEDWPENKPYQTGVVRGKIWTPKEKPTIGQDDDKIIFDIGEEYETALNDASEDQLVDLAAILGLHSMLNQDQFHNTMLNKGQKTGGAKFTSIASTFKPKIVPMMPDNPTDVEQTIKQVTGNDASLTELNWNNIKAISKRQFERLFEAISVNKTLETLNLANTALSDSPTKTLMDSLQKNTTLKIVNVESNYLSGTAITDLMRAINKNKTVVEFRACNQRPLILGNQIEMELAKLIEENPRLIRLGINFDVPDARIRVQQHLKKNLDNVRLKRMGILDFES
ncbi:Tropomodulin [Nymphon striatum]|nr:Tropomodulin [Nymphon striatum]